MELLRENNSSVGNNSTTNNTTMVSDLPVWSSTSQIVIKISAFLIIMLHVSNITVLSARKRNRTPGNCMVVNLSCSDALLLFILAFIPSCDVCGGEPDPYLQSVFAFCYFASLLSTLAITFDKYISVQYSLRYHSIVTPERVGKTVAVVWLLSGFLALLISVIRALADDWMYFDFASVAI